MFDLFQPYGACQVEVYTKSIDEVEFLINAMQNYCRLKVEEKSKKALIAYLCPPISIDYNS